MSAEAWAANSTPVTVNEMICDTRLRVYGELSIYICKVLVTILTNLRSLLWAFVFFPRSVCDSSTTQLRSKQMLWRQKLNIFFIYSFFIGLVNKTHFIDLLIDF